VTSQNDPMSPTSPAGPDTPASPDAPAGPDTPAEAGHEPAPEQPARTEGTAVYVRRRRAPTLGFWVILALVVGVLAGAVTALVTRVDDLGGVIYFAVTGAVFVGLPLALIAAIIDSVTHRPRRRDRS
jgi:hypothetical protein